MVMHGVTIDKFHLDASLVQLSFHDLRRHLSITAVTAFLVVSQPQVRKFCFLDRGQILRNVKPRSILFGHQLY